MATLITDIDRILKANGKIVMDGQGRFAICRNTGSLILEFNVIGTHFPSLSQNRNDVGSILNMMNKNSTGGGVEIDYSDGTGFHQYPFKTSGVDRGVIIARRPNNAIPGTPTPENISAEGTFNYPVYFYEDLPLPVGTVDDFYDHPRTIKIRFEKFADLKRFEIRWTGLYGSLTEAVGRLRNLEYLSFEQIYHLTGTSGELGKVFGKTLLLSNLGFSLGTAIPDFIINSSTLENVFLADMLNLNSDAVTSRLVDFFSSSFLPNLNSFNLTSCQISYQLPDLQNDMTGEVFLQSNFSTGLRLSPDLSKWQCSRVLLFSTRMPVAEYQRILEDSLIKSIQLRSNNVTVDYDLSVNNTTLTGIEIQDNYGGFLPTFLSKLTVLQDLYVYPNNIISGWGASGVSDTLTTLTVERLTLLDTAMPTWFINLVNLISFNSWSWQTTTRIDDHITSFYAQVDANAPMTGTGLFRGLNYSLVNNVLATNTNVRPTGTYAAPSGYVQGSANGTPANSMERIYVLVNQYEMIVSVLNVAGDGQEVFTP